MTEDWLCINGLEVINANRVLSYVRAFGGTQEWVAMRRPRIAEPSGQIPENLACFCSAMEDPARVANAVTYVSPITDNAPWYTAADVRSGEFLGVHANVELGTPFKAATTQFRLGAGGQLTLKGRPVFVNGVLIAKTQRGMEYGRRWLSDALAQRSGDNLDCTARVLPSCEQTAFRDLDRVLLVDGPVLTPFGKTEGLVVEGVSWQLQAGLPWLFASASNAISVGTVLGQVATPTVVPLIAGTWVGDLSTVITLTAKTNASRFAFQITDVPPGISDANICNTAAYGRNSRSGEIRTILLNKDEVLIIDSAHRRIRWFGQAGDEKDGFAALTLPQRWQWLDVKACGRSCLSMWNMGAGATNTVSVQTVRREL